MRSGDAVTLRAHAKLNLRLRVFGRDESGYHGLETLFLRIDLADRVAVEPGGSGIEVTWAGEPRAGGSAGVGPDRAGAAGGPSVPAGPGNLAWKAVEAYARAADGEEPRGADLGIVLEKRIPAGAGLGGGSADAAAVLRGLDRLYGAVSGRELVRAAGRLGSDVPFALQPADFALGWERGRRLLPLDPPPTRPGLLLIPPYAVSTPEAYRWLDAAREAGEDRTGRASPADPTALLPPAGEIGRWEHLERLAANDFEPVVFERHPGLADARDELRAAGAAVALLAGSGSAVFGLFAEEEARDRARGRLGEREGLAAVPFRTLGDGPRDG